jgi:hypothetical protein
MSAAFAQLKRQIEMIETFVVPAKIASGLPDLLGIAVSPPYA